MVQVATGSNTAGLANVDSNFNLQVRTPINAAQAGFAVIAGQVDAGTITGTVLNRAASVTPANRLETSQVTPLFSDTFNYTAQDSGRWSVSLTTFAVTFSGGSMNINSGTVTTASAVAAIRTYATFPYLTSGQMIAETTASFTQPPQAHSQFECGFLYVTNVLTTPTDGAAFFRIDTTGVLKGVVNYNGVEVTTAALAMPIYSNANVFKVAVDERRAEFWINGVLQASIAVTATNGQMQMSPTLQYGIRFFNDATGPTLAAQAKISDVNIYHLDQADNRPYPVVNGCQGLMAYQGVGGQTMGSTALQANSANPTAAAPTNTTAALGTGLGGNFWETASLAVNTDGIISSFANPAASVTVTGRKLVITGIRWMSIVQTVLAGGPFVYHHTLCFGHTAVALNTAEGAATKAPRRIALGVSTFVATAAVGTVGANLSHTFTTPIVVNPGEFIATAVKNIGTVGTSGTIHHSITFDGYWD
jgi:hypothetical protein